MRQAGQIRGEAKAEETPTEAWDPFHALVERAEDQLLKAAELDRDDPLPWVRLIGTAMLLGDSIEERLHRFEEARLRTPEYHGSYIAAAAALSCKWGGSHELMFRFAREHGRSAIPGSSMAAVLPYAHVERWLYLVAWEDDVAAADEYFRRPSVRDEILDAHRRCREIPLSTVPGIANLYAFCFYLGGMRKEARLEFSRSGGVFNGVPWGYLGEARYRKAIEECW
jgi:hypothetical protein